jgi:hypothetical protein
MKESYLCIKKKKKKIEIIVMYYIDDYNSFPISSVL